MPACPECGGDNPDRSRFCSACGAQLSSQPPERDPMIRKVVTILFADLAGSTTLAERHDPEPLRHVIGRYFDEMQRVLERHAVGVERIESLTLKGKEFPVPAFRLVDVRMEAPGIRRRLDSPIVGREHELARLRALFDEAVANGCCS